METVKLVALVLVIIGALNWGLVGVFDFNLVSALFGLDTALTNLVYILVGLSALVCFASMKDSFVRMGSGRH